MSQILCPKCGSDQIAANKKGFSGRKAVAGAVLTGGIGLLAGTLGSNKIKITCLSCGHQFRPGEGAKSQGEVLQKKEAEKIDAKGCLILLVVVLLIGVGYKACTAGNDKDDKQTEIRTQTNSSENSFQVSFINQKTEHFKQLIEQNKSATDIKSESLALTQKLLKDNNYQLTDWTGEIIAVDMFKDKEEDISLTILTRNIVGQKMISDNVMDCGITIEGSQGTYKKLGLKGIPRKGQLYEKIKNLQEGDKVIFSAKVVNAEDNTEKTGLNLTTQLNLQITDIKKQ